MTQKEIYEEVAQTLRKFAGRRVDLDDLYSKYEDGLSQDMFEEILVDLEDVFDIDGNEFIELFFKEINPVIKSNNTLTIKDIIDLIIEKKGPYEAH